MAREFLLNRGITEETWFKANLGFAAGVPEGIPNKDLLSVGLVLPQTFSPVLENRIVFAIHDQSCNIVHLQGRTLGLDWRAEQKYMQLSRDTPNGVYPISHYLHGEEQLADRIDYAFLNEGIPDSLIMRQMGFYSFGTIGNQGFHAHAYKLNKLKRLYVVMDNDEASQSKVASELARLQAKLPNTDVYNVTLPKEPGQDKMDTNEWYLKHRPSKYQFIEVVDQVAEPATKLVIDTWCDNKHKHYQIAEVISTANDPEQWVHYFSMKSGIPKVAINYLITVVTPVDRSGFDGPSWSGWQPFKTAD
jgi:DNA primase